MTVVPLPPARVRGHRRQFEPTSQQRAQVTAMVLADIEQELIARCIGCNEKTLRKHFRRELDQSYALVKSQIAGKIVTQARAGDFKAARFYLACHGWVESERLVVADGGIDDSDISSMSDAQISARIAKLKAKRR